MKTALQGRRSSESGYALLLTITFGAMTLMLVAGALTWSVNNMQQNARNNQYFRTVAAAEAATELVMANLGKDYQASGDSVVQANLATYRTTIPTSSQNSLWSGYMFGNDLGQTGQTKVVFVPPTEFRDLSSQFRGLKGYSSTYEIVSNARELNSQFRMTAGIKNTIETDTIPLFQFAIFYNLDLEINPGPNMTITGPVHSNGTIYTEPQATLTFLGDLSAAGNILATNKPGDPSNRTLGTIVDPPNKRSGVPSITMPIGTNNTPDAVHQVLELPVSGESATSPLGKQRFYNQADLVIKVTDGGVTASSGLVNNFATSIPSSQISKFVDTSVTFFNKRENKTIKTTQIDVSKLRAWNQTNTLLRSVISGNDIKIVYVIDQRSQSSSTESGVRLVNGETILPKGLTIATPNPIYVKGHYNAPSADRGTSDTSGTLPASLIGDAITILSPDWSDGDSSAGLSSRGASDTTVNAAILAGIVETDPGSYSGGVENFPRFLEDWSGRTFTYNGSMVVMFESRIATGQWQGTGSSIGIYNPPTRNWTFDTNFRDPTKIPPGTPSARQIARVNWVSIRPSYTL